MKLRLNDTEYDLKQLLSDAVPPAAVPPAAVPPAAVPPAAVPPAAVPPGRYDKYHQAYPEAIKIHLKTGSTAFLKQEASKRDMSVSKLIRTALTYYLENTSE